MYKIRLEITSTTLYERTHTHICRRTPVDTRLTHALPTHTILCAENSAQYSFFFFFFSFVGKFFHSSSSILVFSYFNKKLLFKIIIYTQADQKIRTIRNKKIILREKKKTRKEIKCQTEKEKNISKIERKEKEKIKNGKKTERNEKKKRIFTMVYHSRTFLYVVFIVLILFCSTPHVRCISFYVNTSNIFFSSYFDFSFRYLIWSFSISFLLFRYGMVKYI